MNLEQLLQLIGQVILLHEALFNQATISYTPSADEAPLIVRASIVMKQNLKANDVAPLFATLGDNFQIESIDNGIISGILLVK